MKKKTKAWAVKTEEQTKIDAECGCECHDMGENTQNYMWCGNCGEEHKNDSRYSIPSKGKKK